MVDCRSSEEVFLDNSQDRGPVVWEILTLTLPCIVIDTLMRNRDPDSLMKLHIFGDACPSLPSLGFSRWTSGPVTICTKNTLWTSIFRNRLDRHIDALYHLCKPWKMFVSVLFKRETTWSWRQSVIILTLVFSNCWGLATTRKTSSYLTWLELQAEIGSMESMETTDFSILSQIECQKMPRVLLVSKKFPLTDEYNPHMQSASI